MLLLVQTLKKKKTKVQLYGERLTYMTEVFRPANQWTGFYMRRTSVMKELLVQLIVHEYEIEHKLLILRSVLFHF